MTGYSRSRLLPLLLLLAAVPAARAQAPLSYRLELPPEDPAVGEVASVLVLVEGLSAAGLEVSDPGLDEGLSLEAKTVRPRVEAGGWRGVEILLELRVLSAGKRLIRGMAIRGREGSLLVAPFSFSAHGRGRVGEGAAEWRWSVPSSVLRYEAFELRLLPRDGSPPPLESSASFPPPAGMALEPDGPLSWTGIALESGEIVLPEASIASASRPLGKAFPSALRVRALPAFLGSSRAQGRFTLELLGPLPAGFEEGRQALMKLLLSGRGNLPILLLPEPRITIEGEALPPEAISLRRLDASRPGRGAYEGSAALEIGIRPHRPGRLRLVFAPLPILEPGGAEASLSVAAFEAAVAPASALAEGQTGSRRQGPFDETLRAALAGLGASIPELAALPGLIEEARQAKEASSRRRAYNQALELFRGWRSAQGASSRLLPLGAERCDLLEAGLLWEAGEGGQSLALLYGLLRRAPRTPGAAGIAQACSGELGSGPPLLDPLPPPRPFAIAALLALGLSLGLLLASIKRGRKAPVLAAAAACSLALALAAGGLALAAKLERDEPYALAWTDRLLPVPSAQAEGSIPIVKGSTGKLRGQSSGFVGLILPGEIAGWVRPGEIFYY